MKKLLAILLFFTALLVFKPVMADNAFDKLVVKLEDVLNELISKLSQLSSLEGFNTPIKEDGGQWDEWQIEELCGGKDCLSGYSYDTGYQEPPPSWKDTFKRPENVVDTLTNFLRVKNNLIVEEGGMGIGVSNLNERVEIDGNIRFESKDPVFTIQNLNEPYYHTDIAPMQYTDRQIFQSFKTVFKNMEIGENSQLGEENARKLRELLEKILANSPKGDKDEAGSQDMELDWIKRPLNDLEITTKLSGEKKVFIMADVDVSLSRLLCHPEYQDMYHGDDLKDGEEKDGMYFEAYVARDGKRISEVLRGSGRHLFYVLDFPDRGYHTYTVVARADDMADGGCTRLQNQFVKVNVSELKISEL